MTAAITATNRQIRELASVLLAPAIESVFSTRRGSIGGEPVREQTRLVTEAARPDHPKGRIVDENRWLKAANGRLRDVFAPYSRHIYAWATIRRGVTAGGGLSR